MDNHEMTEMLFSYGTLRDEKVQMAVFGRKLICLPDVLNGFTLTPLQITDPRSVEISGKALHTILRPADDGGESIEGHVMRVTLSELEQADRYEPKEVKRIKANLLSGAQAWVYVSA